MQKCSLRETLIQIEVAIKKNDLDTALRLYEKINKNWGEYKKTLNKEEVKALIKLTGYIEKLLLEKKKNFFDRKKFFQLRKAYSRF